MKTRFTLAIMFAMLFLSPNNLFSNDIEWLIDSISANGDLDERFTVQSFAFDSDNTYHMVFNRMGEEGELENGGFTTFYTSKPCNGNWAEPEIIHPYGESTVSASIVCTEEGRIFVCYQRYMPEEDKSWNDVIYVAEKTDQGWVREQIPTPTEIQNWLPQMTADGNGKLHIIWVATPPEKAYEKTLRDEKGEYCNGHKLAYATNMSGEWVTKVLDKVPINGYTLGTRPLIKASSEGTIHMVYRSLLPEDDPVESPFTRMWYATNLTPGGDTWEYEMLQSPRIIDETGYIYLENDQVVHLAIGGRDGWDEPPYTYYTKKENGQWTDMIEVNKIGFGFPTAISVKDKEVFITYIGPYLDGEQVKNGVFLWNKDGENVEEKPVVSTIQNLADNDFVFDRHGNMVLPYLLWQASAVQNEGFEQTIITDSETSSDKISRKPIAVDQNSIQHLVFERENKEKGINELYYQNNFRDTLVWSEPEVIPVPDNYILVNNSSSIAATQHSDNPEIYVSFVADNTTSESREFVLANKTEEGWDFSTIPFTPEDINIESSFIAGTQYNTNILHAAVLRQKQVTEDSIVSVIHYGMRQEGTWYMRELNLGVHTKMVSMEITEYGYAKFIYPHSDGETNKMTILYNDTPGGDIWIENTFETILPVEKISTGTMESGGTTYLFMAAQVKPSANEPSQIYFFICLPDGTILPEIRISSENNNSLNLQNITGYWGYLSITYLEESEDKNGGFLKILELNDSFDGFIEEIIPEVYVENTYAHRWENDILAIITEQGDPETSNLSMYHINLNLDILTWSNMYVLRSGECEDPTGTVNPDIVSGIKVYPNPANDVVNVNLEEFLGEKATISIYDISGRMVYHLEKVDSSDQIKIDVSDFNRGIYLIKAATETHNITKKIIIG